MSCTNASCHASNIQCYYLARGLLASHVTHVNESCHIWMSDVICMNKSWHVWISHVTYKWVTSHLQYSIFLDLARRLFVSGVAFLCDMTHGACRDTLCVQAHMNESCLTCEWVIPQMWMSRVMCEMTRVIYKHAMSRINLTCHAGFGVRDACESCRTCERVMSHINQSCRVQMSHVTPQIFGVFIWRAGCWRVMSHMWMIHVAYEWVM